MKEDFDYFTDEKVRSSLDKMSGDYNLFGVVSVVETKALSLNRLSTMSSRDSDYFTRKRYEILSVKLMMLRHSSSMDHVTLIIYEKDKVYKSLSVSSRRCDLSLSTDHVTLLSTSTSTSIT